MNEITWTPTVILSGTARGVDSLGERWAQENNIPIEYHPANWAQYGRSAGPIRNMEMAMSADALICIYDGQSKGSVNMIKIAKEFNLKIFVYEVK